MGRLLRANGPTSRCASASPATGLSHGPDPIARERDAMRLGRSRLTGHWHTYPPALEHVAGGTTLVAVAPAGPEETTEAGNSTQLVLDSNCVPVLLPKDDQPDD